MDLSSPSRNPGCFLADVGGCDGRLQDHHLVKQQAIRRRWRTLNAAFRRGGPRPWSLRKALDDARLQLRICKRHHDMIESRELHVSRDNVPRWAQAAVDEYGLEAEGGLLRDYSPPV